jgi:hypothetical protein
MREWLMKEGWYLSSFISPGKYSKYLVFVDREGKK